MMKRPKKLIISVICNVLLKWDKKMNSDLCYFANLCTFAKTLMLN
mgnify:CR=1 FL=1